MQFLVIMLLLFVGSIWGFITVIDCDDETFDWIIQLRKYIRGK